MTLADLRRAAELLPPGASVMLLRETVLAVLDVGDRAEDQPSAHIAAPSWQERLWTVAADTRMSLADVCEALQRPKSWGYRHTSPASGLPRIPHRKLDGELVFVAGEVRAWVSEHEEIIVKHATVTPISRARRAAGEQ